MALTKQNEGFIAELLDDSNRFNAIKFLYTEKINTKNKERLEIIENNILNLLKL